MACRGPDTSQVTADRLRAQIDLLTRMLCETMTHLEKGHQDVAQSVIRGNPELHSWWENHKQQDAERKAQEEQAAAEKAAREKLVQSAKELLSPEQLAALQEEMKQV